MPLNGAHVLLQAIGSPIILFIQRPIVLIMDNEILPIEL